MTPACRVALNVERRYGTEGLFRLVRGLEQGESHSRLAERFEVSKARVGQWALALGKRKATYRILPEIASIANEKEPRSGDGG